MSAFEVSHKHIEAMITGYVKRRMTPTDAKRELSRTYPAPMRTR